MSVAAIVGAGVVGAAVAQRLARRGFACFILERRDRIGGETTERNSGVIHAGLYYPLNARKTRLCVRGNRLLYAWAARAGVAHARTGKLIVATREAEEAALLQLLAHGRSAGVEGLELWSAAELVAREPAVHGIRALFSPATGIVDPAELTASLVADARACGAEVVTRAEVTAAAPAPSGGWALETTRGPIAAEVVVNAAGLFADQVAALAGVDRYRIHPCRGDYYRLTKTLPVRHLVYPVKDAGSPGLGVHLTLDLAGRQRFGPDANYVAQKNDYADPILDRREAFAASARKLFRGVEAQDLEYDSCGLRPKLRAPGAPSELDFVIALDRPGWVNLVGIESPGLTAALAIAEEVEQLLASS
jgi:L-2-hydroxyglutarate oxidase LhgO